MDKPDWKDAPVDAMYWGPDTPDFHESWYKAEGETWSCVNVDAYRLFRVSWFGLGTQMRRTDLEPRP